MFPHYWRLLTWSFLPCAFNTHTVKQKFWETSQEKIITPTKYGADEHPGLRHSTPYNLLFCDFLVTSSPRCNMAMNCFVALFPFCNVLLDGDHSTETIDYSKSMKHLETRDSDFSFHEFFVRDIKNHIHGT